MPLSPVKYTPVETINLTSQVMKVLDNSEAKPLKFISLTIFVTPLAAAVDAVAHLILFAAKFVTGLVITPYNEIAPNKIKAPKNFEMGNAFKHLAVSITRIFSIVTVPLLFTTVFSENVILRTSEKEMTIFSH